MTLKTGAAPHIRRTDRACHMSADVLITLVPLCIFSAVYYGMRPVLLVLAGMLSAMFCETVCCLLMRRRPTVIDGTAAVTGGLVGAMMSPLSPYWLPMLAAAFAIVVVKMPFGGTGRNVFNPAAAGMAVATLCFAERLFAYPDPSRTNPLPLDSVAGVVAVQSPAASLQAHANSAFNWHTLLFGDIPGPIGATAIAVLAACALYLFVRRSASPLITLPYLAVCVLAAVWFPRTAGSWQNSVLLELSSGYLLFCGVFLLTDPVTAPRHWLGRVVYGVLAGVLVMTLRHAGKYEAGACFAVLLVNAFAPVLDRWCWRLVHTAGKAIRRRKAGISA